MGCPLLTCQTIFFLLPNSLVARNSIFMMLMQRKKLKRKKKSQDLKRNNMELRNSIQKIRGLQVSSIYISSKLLGH